MVWVIILENGKVYVDDCSESWNDAYIGAISTFDNVKEVISYKEFWDRKH